MAVPFPIIVIVNVVLYGLLLIRVVVSLIQKLVDESNVPSVKRKLVHVVLVCFGITRFVWSMQELLAGNSPRTIHFFLDTTAMCLFFTAFIIVFFHLLKKLSGWNMSRSTFFLILALFLNTGVYAYMLAITIDSAITHKPTDSGVFFAGSIVIAAYSILNAMGFLVIGIRVWRNMSLLNKFSRPSLSQDQRRKGAIMIGITIIVCISFFAMRLVVFTLKPDFIISNDESFKFTSYLFGYWLAEAPPTLVMLYVMKRSYKSTPLLDDTPYRTGAQTGSFVSSPLPETSATSIFANQLRSTFSITDFASPVNREDSVHYNQESGLPKVRVEFAVSCTFPIARRPVIGIMQHSFRSVERATIDKSIDRTEIRSKGNAYCTFKRTLLFVGDINTEFYFAVFDNPVESSDNQMLQFVGETSFSIREAHKAHHNTITKDILICDRRGDAVENNGSITIEIIMEEACVRKKSTSITKSYRICEDDDSYKLHMREELTESRFAFQCAYQLLKILIPLRGQELAELNKKQTQLGNQAVHNRNSLPTQDMGDIFGNMMIGIMDNNEETSTFQWFTTLLQHFTKHFESLKVASELYKMQSLKPYKNLTFKPSTYKADVQLGFIATNLHSQELQIFDPTHFNEEGTPQPYIRYETITFGAPAAHIFKFKHGIRSLQHKWLKALQYLKSKNCDPQQASTLVREVEALNLEIRQRHDVVMCQSVAALVTCFSKKIENSCQMEGGERFLKQIGEVGFLFQVESLLSTNGHEIGMLEDMDVAIKDLSKFSFVLEDASIAGLHRVRFERDQNESPSDALKELVPPYEGASLRIIIKLSISSTHFNKLPESLQNGAPIKVHPLLFTQGINEQQTIANTVGDSSLQEEINKENMMLFWAFFRRYEAYLSKIGASDEIGAVESELHTIEKIIQGSRREKNVEILSKTSDLVRRILGGRATCCKSAKDRTSMSVTWEQARILESRHSLSKAEMADTIQVMRSAGVRRENAFKNIGVDKYAFNQLQIMLIPEIYKPPKGTEGARVT